MIFFMANLSKIAIQFWKKKIFPNYSSYPNMFQHVSTTVVVVTNVSSKVSLRSFFVDAVSSVGKLSDHGVVKFRPKCLEPQGGTSKFSDDLGG